jgi:uncharacterized lipoprotein YajG
MSNKERVCHMKKIVLLLLAALLLLSAGCQKEEVTVQSEIQDPRLPIRILLPSGKSCMAVSHKLH